MGHETYGVVGNPTADDQPLEVLEELRIQGYSVVEAVLNERQLEQVRQRLDTVYAKQEEELGREFLAEIDELDTARCPLAYDGSFIQIASEPRIVEIAHKAIGGGYVILSQQNGILNRPGQRHHQSSWHRDLPYQDFVSSRPLAISALYCIDDFSQETGATHVLPHSHRFERMPSATYCEEHEVTVEAPAGSVIILDSMLYHRAGHNRSDRIRRAINNVYCIPILKQQISLKAVLRNEKDAFLRKLLDDEGDVPTSVVEYRQRRHRRVRPS